MLLIAYPYRRFLYGDIRVRKIHILVYFTRCYVYRKNCKLDILSLPHWNTSKTAKNVLQCDANPIAPSLHEMVKNTFKVRPSPFKKSCFICFNESPLKVMKNAFHFILKTLFVLKILKFLSWLFGYAEKTAWLAFLKLTLPF